MRAKNLEGYLGFSEVCGWNFESYIIFVRLSRCFEIIMKNIASSLTPVVFHVDEAKDTEKVLKVRRYSSNFSRTAFVVSDPYVFAEDKFGANNVKCSRMVFLKWSGIWQVPDSGSSDTCHHTHES